MGRAFFSCVDAMMRRRATMIGGLVAVLLAGCSQEPKPALPVGPQAYATVPEGDVLQARDYLIGPLDALNIAVFREPDLSVDKAVVDSDGKVQVPLIGPVQAIGLTTGQLARAIEAQLGARYLTKPSVTVTLTTSSRNRVTVDGAVAQPGVYEMPGRISLIDAVALARGATTVAEASRVAVIRRVGGRRMGGVFDLGRIRAGIDADPEIVAGDQVIVGTSALRASYRDLMQAVPLLNFFTVF